MNPVVRNCTDGGVRGRRARLLLNKGTSGTPSERPAGERQHYRKALQNIARFWTFHAAQECRSQQNEADDNGSVEAGTPLHPTANGGQRAEQIECGRRERQST